MDSYDGRDLEVLAEMPNYYAWIMEALAPHVRGRVIEYGAGTGTITHRLLPHATSLVAVEPSKNLTAALQSRVGANVDVRCETLEEHAVREPDQSADTIVMINVLEHIEDDRAALRNLIRILRPGGALLLFVPALQLLMSEIDRVHGHYRRYHRADLRAKVAEAGATVIHCAYFDMFGVVPWLILNKALSSTTFNPALVRLNDRIVVPVSRAIERLFDPPFGKNLVLVARKPG